MEMTLPNILNGKKVKVVQTVFPIFCHFSKYMRLALTDFHENRVFNRNCMWLQLSQILKKFTKRNARKLTVIFTRDVTKIRKTRVVSRVRIHLGTRSCHAIYCMRESKSKLELFYRLFRDFFCHIFFWP